MEERACGDVDSQSVLVDSIGRDDDLEGEVVDEDLMQVEGVYPDFLFSRLRIRTTFSRNGWRAGSTVRPCCSASRKLGLADWRIERTINTLLAQDYKHLR